MAALELIDEQGQVGLGFVQALFRPLPAVDGDHPHLHRRGLARRSRGSRRSAWCTGSTVLAAATGAAFSLPFEEAVQVALWDLAAKQAGLPLHRLLGSRRDRVRAYASGLDFHLSDDEFTEFFGHADAIGYGAFKIKVGHPDFDRDLHRLDLLSKAVRPGALVMIDSNEAWGAKEALVKLDRHPRRRLQDSCGSKIRSCATISKACACCARPRRGR